MNQNMHKTPAMFKGMQMLHTFCTKTCLHQNNKLVNEENVAADVIKDAVWAGIALLDRHPGGLTACGDSSAKIGTARGVTNGTKATQKNICLAHLHVHVVPPNVLSIVKLPSRA